MEQYGKRVKWMNYSYNLSIISRLVWTIILYTGFIILQCNNKRQIKRAQNQDYDNNKQDNDDINHSQNSEESLNLIRELIEDQNEEENLALELSSVPVS